MFIGSTCSSVVLEGLICVENCSHIRHRASLPPKLDIFFYEYPLFSIVYEVVKGTQRRSRFTFHLRFALCIIVVWVTGSFEILNRKNCY